MVIDIHSHILPGIDDGSKNMKETLEMLSMAEKEGIQGMVATSHYEAGLGIEWSRQYRKAYDDVLENIRKHHIQLQLYVGNEIYYSESIIEALQKEEVHTVNETRYVLIEFPVYADYMYIERALRNIQYAGYWPILAHVERYESLRDLKCVETLADMNICIQMNADSVIRKKDLSTRRFCRKVLKNHLVDVLATDTHGSRHRKPEIQTCFSYIDKKLGKSYRYLISEKNPQKIIKGEKISWKK